MHFVRQLDIALCWVKCVSGFDRLQLFEFCLNKRFRVLDISDVPFLLRMIGLCLAKLELDWFRIGFSAIMSW